jgi:hypothetical protein
MIQDGFAYGPHSVTRRASALCRLAGRAIPHALGENARLEEPV